MEDDRARAKRAALLVLAVYLAGLAALLVPFMTREREVFDSTPGPPPLFDVAPLSFSPGRDLCLTGVPLTPHSEILRLRSGGEVVRPGPVLDVAVTAPGYRHTGIVRVEELGPQLDLPIQPPTRALTAEVCVHNRGRPGVILVATLEPRTRSTMSTRIDGEPFREDVALQILERRRASLADRLTDVMGHAAAFKPATTAVLWAVALLVLTVVPAAVGWALWAGWRQA
jgi:hypothetical protein